MLAQGAIRRQRNQASGNAIATASAADSNASVTEAKSALRHSGLRKISPYQDSEKPCGGKASVCLALTETPATTINGSDRNRPIRKK
ncbi:hypothetical protein D3C86_2066110 [compost metagenome]